MSTAPMGLTSQCSGSGISAAGADAQVVRPRFSDTGTSPVAHLQDPEVTALIGKLMQDMDETRAANARTSLERDEAIVSEVS